MVAKLTNTKSTKNQFMHAFIATSILHYYVYTFHTKSTKKFTSTHLPTKISKFIFLVKGGHDK